MLVNAETVAAPTQSLLETVVRDCGFDSGRQLAEVGAPALFMVMFLSTAYALRQRRSASTVFLVLAGACATWSGILRFVDPDRRWVWLLSAIPAAIVLQHAVLLYVVRRPIVPGSAERTAKMLSQEDLDFFGESLEKTLGQVQATTARYFSVEALALR